MPLYWLKPTTSSRVLMMVIGFDIVVMMVFVKAADKT